MDKVNVVAVFDPKCEKVLMCYRRKNPYKGLYNLVGGKLEKDEEAFHAASRELEEETSITSKQIELHHLMDFVYHFSSIEVQVFYGVLNEMLEVYGEENDLIWMSLNEDFFDCHKFAGKGNIGHMMIHILSLIK